MTIVTLVEPQTGAMRRGFHVRRSAEERGVGKPQVTPSLVMSAPCF
jgi:hypothetical protein